MKRSKCYDYLGYTIGHLDDANLAALYLEALLNDYEEWFRAILAESIATRPDGLETLLEFEVQLYDQGVIGACFPLRVAVLINFRKRGELGDVIGTLVESRNLENAIRVVAANCDWLPEAELNDDTMATVARILKAEIGIS